MKKHTLGIDIGSTTVKIAILDENDTLVFSDYERHFANIQETLADLLQKAEDQLGELTLCPVITGSGGLTLANHLEVPFVQEVIAVSTSLQKLAPKTDVAIELGGEDAKIIYFENGNVEQRMNGICAGGTGSFIDQMASLLQTDAPGLNEYAKHYKALYPIAARCGVFAKTDIQPCLLYTLRAHETGRNLVCRLLLEKKKQKKKKKKDNVTCHKHNHNGIGKRDVHDIDNVHGV